MNNEENKLFISQAATNISQTWREIKLTRNRTSNNQLQPFGLVYNTHCFVDVLLVCGPTTFIAHGQLHKCSSLLPQSTQRQSQHKCTNTVAPALFWVREYQKHTSYKNLIFNMSFLIWKCLSRQQLIRPGLFQCRLITDC